jgi:AraC-like DNA-binding protein
MTDTLEMNNTFIDGSLEMPAGPVLEKTDTCEPAEDRSRPALTLLNEPRPFAISVARSEAKRLAESFASRSADEWSRTAPINVEGSSAPPLLAYAERAVQPALAEHIVCTWVDPARARRNPVLPDACVDLVWDGARLLVAGPDTHSVAISSQATFVGIRFRPGAAPCFLGIGARELLDQTIPLTELWGRSAELLAERLADAPTPAASVLEPSTAAARVLEGALLERQHALWPADPMVRQVVRDLGRSRTEPALVTTLARRLGVDERTLRRRCTEALGYGPKTLDRILRFRRALRLIRSNVPLADAARQAGYTDQSYLTNECRRLANATPSELATGPFTICGNGCN